MGVTFYLVACALALHFESWFYIRFYTQLAKVTSSDKVDFTAISVKIVSFSLGLKVTMRFVTIYMALYVILDFDVICDVGETFQTFRS